MASALDGITILDLTDGPAGAQATMFLCDHGARVVRVVDVNDEASRRGGYLVWDRGKECLRLDLSQVGPPGQRGSSDDARGEAGADEPARIYEELVRGADVLVDSFAPSSDRQTAVDNDWLSSINPRLVHCSITAYGRHGRLKDEAPIDDLVMARMGILASQPGFRPAPVHLVHPLPSVGAALLAAQGIAASLLAREKTGLGRRVETSLMAGALLYHPKVTGDNLVPRPFQTHPAGSAPFYSVYECSDGKWVQLGCVHPRFIASAATVMGIKDVADEPRFGDGVNVPNKKDEMELRDLVGRAIRAKPYDDWARLFDEADVPFAQARTTDEGMDDPQVEVNEMVVDLVDLEVGPISQMGVPVQLSETPGRVKGPRMLPGDRLPDVLTGEASKADDRRPRPPGEGKFDVPLKGVRVLEITNLIAGPTAGRLLADLGADVIKMEPLDGDISRPIGRTYFFNINANKRSLSVNTRTPEGKDVAQRVAASADVLLANMRPHATERMGIGPDALKELNPRLIETHVTGYGWTGPYAHRPGIDPLAQALMGLQRAQGGPENPPVFPAQLAPTDFTAGAMGALGTILALFARERTGIVQRVDTNLINGGAVLSSEFFTRYEGKPARRLADKGQYGLDAFHRLYETSDGWLYVVAQTQEQRAAVCDAAGRGDLADSAIADVVPAADSPLAQELTRSFAHLSLDDSLGRLTKAGVPCGPAEAGDSEVFLDDPHSASNDMIAIHRHPVLGSMRVAGHYIRFGGTETLQGKPTPLLGEQTREVLQEVGFSESAIYELYEKGVVKTEEPASVP